MATLHRWVLHARVEEYLRLGWLVNIPDPDHYCSHDTYSVLMSWVCECPPREP